MVKTCSLVHCRTGYKRKKGEDGEEILKFPVFAFPGDKKDLNDSWIKFVNRKDWSPTDYVGICSRHFEAHYIKVGDRTTLKWELDPVPTIYDPDNEVLKSLLPTRATTRKPPSSRTLSYPNEEKIFKEHDKINSFADLNETLCPAEGYTFMRLEDKVIFYKTIVSEPFDIPEIVATITVDNLMHVKLFKRNSPIPLPEWFRHGTDCQLRRKSALENFPVYISNYTSQPDRSNEILEELQNIKLYKPAGRPKYSSSMLRFALLLRYTSKQAYKLLLQYFPLPSMSLLKKLKQGGIEPLKAVKLLLDNGKVGKDILLLADEMYLEKGMQYQGGEVVGSDDEGNLYKGVMVFMIVSMLKNIPFVIKAVPEIRIDGGWLQSHIEESIESLNQVGFHVRAVVSDDHSTNVSAFSKLIKLHGFDPKIHAIKHPSSVSHYTTYLFFDAVHLLKNLRNNLLNNLRFIFPHFKFNGFCDEIDVPSGEITWKLLHDIYDLDEKLQGNLRKAPKLTYRALHPGNNKQNVNLALSVFHPSTSAAIESYYPERKDAAGFLKLVNTWWTVMNSKQRFNSNNRLGNAAVKGDKKPSFLRKLADWFEEWHDMQLPNAHRFTLSKQTFSAMITTLRCTASLIEELLEEGYDYVLTARLQSDALELFFSKLRQMSGGRFLVSLLEVNRSQQILAIRSLLKESINIWEEDLHKEAELSTESLELIIQEYISDIQSCTLSYDSMEVSVVIAGYIANKLSKRTNCEACKTALNASSCDVREVDYLSKLSRGGLIIPSLSLSNYVAKSFAIMDVVELPIKESMFAERKAAEHILRLNECAKLFVCNDHVHWGEKFVNRIVINTFYNNAQKNSFDSVRQNTVKDFKQRQRKKAKTQ